MVSRKIRKVGKLGQVGKPLENQANFFFKWAKYKNTYNRDTV